MSCKEIATTIAMVTMQKMVVTMAPVTPVTIMAMMMLHDDDDGNKCGKDDCADDDSDGRAA